MQVGGDTVSVLCKLELTKFRPKPGKDTYNYEDANAFRQAKGEIAPGAGNCRAEIKVRPRRDKDNKVKSLSQY